MVIFLSNPESHLIVVHTLGTQVMILARLARPGAKKGCSLVYLNAIHMNLSRMSKNFQEQIHLMYFQYMNT